MRVIVLGSGKRVQQGALPALWSLGAPAGDAAPSCEVAGVYARTAKTVTAAGREVAVHAIDDLDARALAEADLVFMAVAKKAVPEVLARLGALGAGGTDLLIDTPVLTYKHMGFLGRLAAFRNVWVAEDCTRLPAFDLAAEVVASGAIGDLRRIVLNRSAYAYHGLAMARCLFGPRAIRSGRRKGGMRRVRFRGGYELIVHEPRDYRVGRMRLEGTNGAISDGAAPDGALFLEPVLGQGACTGFRIGEHVHALTEVESALLGAPLDGAEEPLGPFAFMEGMKRVGLARMLADIAQGRGGYPLADAIDDTVVDYHLEKFGVYLANPLTHPRHMPARMLLGAIGRLVGGR